MAVAGALVFAWLGAAEAFALSRSVPVPDIWPELRWSVLAHAAVGALTGGAWGFVCELPLLRRRRFRRRVFYGLSLPLLILLAQAIAHTHWHMKSVGRDGGTIQALMASEAAAALLLLAVTWVLCVRRPGTSPATRLMSGRIATILAAPLALLVIAPSLRPSPTTDSSGSSPSVLLIVMDTTRFDRLSTYGYDRPTTPRLDEVASQGLKLTRAYSAAPITLSSHASMFTAQLTRVHQAGAGRKVLDDQLRTMAEHLAQQGLATVAVHKKANVSAELGLMRGFGEVFDLRLARPTAMAHLHSVLARKLLGRTADAGAQAITQTFLTWLDRRGREPFFAFINFNEPHARYTPPSPFREQYLGDRADTPWGRRKHCFPPDFNLGKVHYSEAEIEVFSDLYDAEVAYQDQRMGELFDALREREMLDDLLLIITSDHGELFGEHDLLGHGVSLYDPLLHVPLIIRCPDVVPAGVSEAEGVETRLLWPLIDAVRAASGSGRSLSADEVVAELRNHEEADRPVFAEHGDWERGVADERARPWLRAYRSMKVGRLKYIARSDGTEALFDLTEDPRETQNLVSEQPEIARELAEQMTTYFNSLARGTAGEEANLSEQLLHELRSLGYLR